MNLDHIQEEDAQPSGGDILKRLSSLADDALELAEQISKAQADLDSLTQRQKKLLRDTIPSVMSEAGNIKSFTTSSGFAIEIKDEIQASITEQNAQTAFRWLEANNFGGLIKTKLEIDFGRDEGERELLSKTKAALDDLSVSPLLKESVHPATLKSFVKEQLANPENTLPLETFGVFQYTVATIKAPKAKVKK